MADASSTSHISDLRDAVLVARARAGDASAFSTLVARYYEPCLRYAIRFLAHREDAEDAVQDSWMRVHRSLAAYRERDVFERWLFRIVLNVCRTASVRRTRDARRFVAGSTDRPEPAAPIGELASGQTIEAMLQRLDPRTREALVLKHGLGLDYAEMARRTGDSVSALKMRVKRGIAALKLDEP